MRLFKKKTVAIACIAVLTILLGWAFIRPMAQETAAQIEPDGLACVMYHHVLGENSKLLGDYVISKSEFEADLAWLAANGYETVSASQIIDFVNGGAALPKKPVFITFDDGYESFYANAQPLLEKYQAKALASVIGRYSALYSAPDISKHLNYSHMSWEQIRELDANALVEIGNHSFNRHDATGRQAPRGAKKSGGENAAQYAEKFAQDTEKLQDSLRENSGVTPKVYAYPFGFYSDTSEEILREMGFQMTLSCEEGNTKLTQDPSCLFLLKRYNRAHGISSAQFFAKMGLK